jgi:Kef-type K+ transport system membrane component KefB
MSSGESNLIPNLLCDIALIWGFSSILNILFDKLKLPKVLGELCTGLLFGIVILFTPEAWWIHNHLSLIRDSEPLMILGELGIILLLFEVGLETELKNIASVGKEALLVALGGVVAPFLMAWGIKALFGFDWSVELTIFIGLVLAATSIGVTARVFQDLKILHTLNAQVVLGAAVLDDIIGLILLSVITAFVQQSEVAVSTGSIVIIILKAILFLAGAVLLGSKLVSPKILPALGRACRHDSLGFLLWVLTFCFLFSYLAYLMGLAPIVGAFAAGITLDPVKIKGLFGETKTVEDYISPIRAILAPIFFVKVGLAINPALIFVSYLPLLLTLVACLSKIVSGWMFLPFKTSINRLLVGVSMMPRGEVGLVVAAIGSQIGLLTDDLYSAVLVAVIATTFIAPLWLQILAKNKEAPAT